MVNYKRGAACFLSAYFGHASHYSAIGQCCIRGRFYYIVCTAYPQEFTVAVLHICLLSPPFLAPCHQGKTHSTWSTPRSLPAHSLVGTDPTCDSLHPCVGNTGKARSHWALEECVFIFIVFAFCLSQVISYFERAVLGVWFLALGWLWPWFLKRNVRQKHRRLLIGWCVSCTATSLFMYLPVELQSNQLLANVGAAAVAAIGILVTFIPDRALMNQRRTKGQHAALLFQVLLVMVAAWTVTNTTAAFRDRRPLPPVNQAISWAVLLVSFVMPAFTTSRHYVHRMVVLFLAFGAPLVLLAVSYETLFYALLGVNLYVWLQLERAIYADRAVVSIDWLLNGDGDDGESVIVESDKRPARSGETSRTRSTRKVGSVIDATLPVSFAAYRALSAEDIRVAVLFLFYINVAFFGTGNVASLASFQLSSIYRLTTMFDPFLMAALLVVKILIPFLLLSAVSGGCSN